MCGIVGFVSAENFQENTILEMTSKLESRGPDDSGVWINNSLGIHLGHRRLSILDLSKEGKQPMESYDKRYILIFNGEIYNHINLRKEIEKIEKISWRGTSDTETAINYITTFGFKKFLDNANGMFALALLDLKEKKIYLSKDRLGEKPLYYGWNNGIFFFGSTLKAFAPHPKWTPVIDKNVLHLYIKYSYIPTPYSIFKNIKKLPAASYLKFDLLERKESEPIKYWDLLDLSISKFNNRHKENDIFLIDELDRRIKDAVRLRMISDVPIGAFLSGGIDSSLIAAQMQSISNKPINTFTIGFNIDSYNEADHAKNIAKHLKTNHIEHYVSPKETLDLIPSLNVAWDEPFADSSQIPTLLISQITQQKVSVALSGDGGDELFCGYNRYNIGYDIFKKLSKLPPSLRNYFSYVLDIFPTQFVDSTLSKLNFTSKYSSIGDKFQKISNILRQNDEISYYKSLISIENNPSRFLIQGKEPPTILTNSDNWPEVESFQELMMILDMKTYLQDDILVKLDRASMFTSLETRAPYLDHKLIEWSLSLPKKLKSSRGLSKLALRKVLNKYIPKELIDRPKMGFGVPIDIWLKKDLRDWVEDLLSKEELSKQGIFDTNAIRSMWEEHLKGTKQNHHKLWSIINFQSWHREWNNNK